MATQTTTMTDGRIVHGLAQTLAAWLAASFVAWLITHPAVPWVWAGAGLLSSLLLGKWHQRNARRDAAVGAFTGAVLWPVLIGAALIAINAASMIMYDFE